IDLQAAQLRLAVEGRLHHAAAGLAGHLELAELLLHLGHLGLHRLRLLHHLAQVLHRSSAPSSKSPSIGGAGIGAAACGAGLRSRRATSFASGKVSMTACTRGCCMTAARLAASSAFAWWRSVSAPGCCEMVMTQRPPQAFSSTAAKRLARFA